MAAEMDPELEVSINPLMLEAARHVGRMLTGVESGEPEAIAHLEESQQQVIALMRGLSFNSDDLWPVKHRNLAAGLALHTALEAGKQALMPPPKTRSPQMRAAKKPSSRTRKK